MESTPGNLHPVCSGNGDCFLSSFHVIPCMIFLWIKLQQQQFQLLGNSHRVQLSHPLAVGELRLHATPLAALHKTCTINQKHTADAGNNNESPSFALKSVKATEIGLLMLSSQQQAATEAFLEEDTEQTSMALLIESEG